jgi:hypothetical protein
MGISDISIAAATIKDNNRFGLVIFIIVVLLYVIKSVRPPAALAVWL